MHTFRFSSHEKSFIFKLTSQWIGVALLSYRRYMFKTVLFIHNDCVSVSVDDRALGNVENIYIVSTQMFKLCFCVGTLFFLANFQIYEVFFL